MQRLTLQIFIFFVLIIDDVFIEAARGGRKTAPKPNPLPKNTVQDSVTFDPNSRLEFYNNPKGARITKASHFDYEYVLGHKIVFICESKGTPRPQFTWFKDTMEIFAHPYVHIHEWKIDNNMTKSKLEIDPATQMDAGIYECHANNKYAIDRRTFKADFSISE